MNILDGIKEKITGKSKANTPEEEKILSDIISNQTTAEAERKDIEVTWDDEYKCFTGDQWSLSFARRSKDAKRVRPNSVDNFIFPSIMGMHSMLTATTPEATLEICDGDNETDDKELEQKVTDNVANILDKNKFPQLWKKIVLRGISHGPFIGAVLWDNDWIGGVGPNRWIGEVKVIAQKKEEIFFDPAILDLEERMQECSFVNRKIRKKTQYFKDRWGKKGALVQVEDNADFDEGANHNQAWLYESWHKGKPKMMPAERKQELLNKAQDYLPPSVTLDYFKAEKYKQMASGKVDGVHVAYVSKDIFLEYVPYAYEDGLYPFIYKVMYIDDKSPWGFGEIRNVMVPQVMHNKADEIEIEAMSVTGLGGYFYNAGALSSKQLAFIEQNNAKGGMLAEVNNVNQMKERQGAQVPGNIPQYKEHKQRMVETISKNTPIRQGMAPSANMPYKAIAELGARTDTSTKGIVETLEDFLKEVVQLVVNRMKEFYTEERTYKVREQKDSVAPEVIRQLKMIAQMPDSQEKVMAVMDIIDQLNAPVSNKYGTFSNREMIRTWEREPATRDEMGNDVEAKNEEYMPDFTATVKIVDERPTDRNYYINLALQLLPMNLLDMESFWYVIEEGKFPPKEIIMERLEKQKMEDMQTQMQSPMGQTPGSDPRIDKIVGSMSPEEMDMVQNDPQLQDEILGGLA